MYLPNAWRYTSYVLTPRNAAGLVEFWSGCFAPGSTVRPYPAPRTFKAAAGGGRGELVEVVESAAPADELVVHRLAEPCGLPQEPELGPFAVGRLLSARALPRREPANAKPWFEVDARLSCAFQVARLVVPAGRTPRSAHGLRWLAIRLGMKRREDGSNAPEAVGAWSPFTEIDCGELAGRPYRYLYGYVGFPYHPAPPDRSVYGYVKFHYAPVPRYGEVYGCGRFPYGPVPPYQYGDVFPAAPATPGGQRLDRFRATAARPQADVVSSETELDPPRARTISIGWGWETAGDPRTQAFGEIVEAHSADLRRRRTAGARQGGSRTSIFRVCSTSPRRPPLCRSASGSGSGRPAVPAIRSISRRAVRNGSCLAGLTTSGPRITGSPKKVPRWATGGCYRALS